MSARARRIVYPMLAVVVVTFLTFLVHLLTLGTSAFPGGKVIGGRYLVEEHGRVIELTARQYWASYIHGVLLVSVFAAFFLTIVVLYFTGDLKDEYPAA